MSIEMQIKCKRTQNHSWIQADDFLVFLVLTCNLIAFFKILLSFWAFWGFIEKQNIKHTKKIMIDVCV